MLEGLIARHDLQQQITVNTAFNMTVGCHIPRVAPLYAVYNSTIHHLSDPAYVSQQGALCGLLQVLTREGLEDRLRINGQGDLDRKATELQDVLEFFGCERLRMQLVEGDDSRVAVLQVVGCC